MTRLAALATLYATIGATLVMTSTGASAGKPTPPPSPDPCANANAPKRGFPAMVFTRKRTTSGHIYYDTILSDLSGQCQLTIATSGGSASAGPGGDVNLRYESASGNALIVATGAGAATFAASTYSVSFDATGVPTVLSGGGSTILDISSLPTPPDLQQSGWSKYVLGNPLISPDGIKLLATVAFQNAQGTTRSTFWTCQFAAGQPVDVSSCQMVFVGSPAGYQTSGWGGRSDSIYITDTSAAFGSGRSLYRLVLATTLAPLTLTEIWSLGTFFSGAKGSLNTAMHDIVAIYEANQSSSMCSRVLVIDADSCANNHCLVTNGAGTPARTMTWLPNGSVAGEGQTKPNQKGQCFASGSIVTFDPNDANGYTTTVTPTGSQPDGAGGG